VVLAEKPLISEDTDLLEPTLLDELICHISSLASVYHKPPSAFVEGRTSARRFTLPARAEPTPPSAQTEASPPVAQQATVIPSHPPQGESLIGDLIGMDFGGGMPPQPAAAMPPAAMSK
jgi:AP-1 complex subunit beta-1